mgnify:CR=1 FL=1
MLYLLCLLPPLAVFFSGFKPFTLILNIILTCFGYLPGVIHAFIVVHGVKSGDQTNKIVEAMDRRTEM